MTAIVPVDTRNVDTQNAPAIAAPTPFGSPATITRTLENLQLQAQAWSYAAQIGEQIARTDFAGQFKGKPADMTVAILAGASLGIPPEQIGKSVYVVHGAPGLYGKTALAIAKASGYEVERTIFTAQEVAIKVTAPNGKVFETSYTFARADREGLVKGNKLQYTTRPEKMLFWKCIGEAADQFFPHLLNGMPIKEDWEQSPPIQMEATRGDVPSSPEIEQKAAARTANANAVASNILHGGQQPAQAPNTTQVAPEPAQPAPTPQAPAQPAIPLDDDGYPSPNTGHDQLDEALFGIISRIKTAASHDELLSIHADHFPELPANAAAIMKQALTTRKQALA